MLGDKALGQREQVVGNERGTSHRRTRTSPYRHLPGGIQKVQKRLAGTYGKEHSNETNKIRGTHQNLVQKSFQGKIDCIWWGHTNLRHPSGLASTRFRGGGEWNSCGGATTTCDFTENIIKHFRVLLRTLFKDSCKAHSRSSCSRYRLKALVADWELQCCALSCNRRQGPPVCLKINWPSTFCSSNRRDS